MNNKTSLFFLVLLLAVVAEFILTSSSAGRAFAASDGNTGAPNEPQTCMGCHGTGFSTTVTLNVRDSSGGIVNSYQPGTIYSIDFVVNSVSGPVGYGFQMVALDRGNNSLNGFSNPSKYARVITIGSTGRQYAEHTKMSPDTIFSVEWQAPQAGTGDVIFYGSGAAVNGDSNNSGDGGNVTVVTLTENGTVGLKETTLNDDFLIYPNPASDFITVFNKSKSNSVNSLEIISYSGQPVLCTSIALSPQDSQNIDISSLTKGLYYVKINTSKENRIQKILIQ